MIEKRRDELEPGMVLARDVIDAGGRVLLKAGEELDPSSLAWLERFDVASVFVKGGDEPAFRQAPEEIEERFRRVKGDPLMERIKAELVSILTGGAGGED